MAGIHRNLDQEIIDMAKRVKETETTYEAVLDTARKTIKKQEREIKRLKNLLKVKNTKDTEYYYDETMNEGQKYNEQFKESRKKKQ